METLPNQSQTSPGYCAICTPARKQCPTEYLMPLKSHWSGSDEEEKDNNVQKGEEIKDWDGDL